MLESASRGGGVPAPGGGGRFGAWTGGGVSPPGGCLLQGGWCLVQGGVPGPGGPGPGVSQHALRQTPLPPPLWTDARL